MAVFPAEKRTLPACLISWSSGPCNLLLTPRQWLYMYVQSVSRSKTACACLFVCAFVLVNLSVSVLASVSRPEMDHSYCLRLMGQCLMLMGRCHVLMGQCLMLMVSASG